MPSKTFGIFFKMHILKYKKQKVKSISIILTFVARGRSCAQAAGGRAHFLTPQPPRTFFRRLVGTFTAPAASGDTEGTGAGAVRGAAVAAIARTRAGLSCGPAVWH